MTDHAARLDAMRAAAPLVHNIANLVSMNVMANVMLAAGASPAMVHAAEEVREFIGHAEALTINIGTLSPGWVPAMVEAAEAANATGTPWVLDPVGVGATAHRRQTAERLTRLRPSVIRGNASEIIALTGMGGMGKGVDSADAVTDAANAAQILAKRTGGIVAVTGAQDFVTDGTRAAWIDNGDPLMPRITALGCALTGVVAAFLATSTPPFDATITALAYYGIAGERAAVGAAGPGSFAVAFIDALYALDGKTLQHSAKVRYA